VWAIGITLFGYVFGRNLEFVDKVLSRFGYIMLGVVVGFIVGRIVWKKLRARSKQSAK
jgi:membrane protein DedA with SNARE-associated domain